MEIRLKSAERRVYEEMLANLEKVAKETDVTAAVASGYPYRVTFTEQEQPNLLDDYEQLQQLRASVAVVVSTDVHLIVNGRLTMTKAQMKKLCKSAEDLADMFFKAFVADNWEGTLKV